MGTTREPWKPRSTKTWVKDKRPGRQILIDRGRLRQSIRITSTTGDTAKIGTDVPYAKAHNEGFKGTVTQKVGSYSRRVQSGAKVIVRAHSRTIKQKIPKRQFMGYSPVLETQLKAKLKAQLLKGFEGLKF
jgi:phage gpG-like protein